MFQKRALSEVVCTQFAVWGTESPFIFKEFKAVSELATSAIATARARASAIL